LRKLKRENKKFDLIILDPPAFCKSASEVEGALRGYKDINILAMQLLNEGGILATCSCSHYMTMQLFENMLVDASRESKHTVKILERRTQSPDHPSLVGSDETLYLKFYILQVD
ncbi:MAG: rRNA large subunit methyltransferase I, partial [Clostridia bacterium]